MRSTENRTDKDYVKRRPAALTALLLFVSGVLAGLGYGPVGEIPQSAFTPLMATSLVLAIAAFVVSLNLVIPDKPEIKKDNLGGTSCRTKNLIS